jgi:hypothetical protein
VSEKYCWLVTGKLDEQDEFQKVEALVLEFEMDENLILSNAQN